MSKSKDLGRLVRATVQTEERAEELLALCESRGRKAVIGIEPYRPEDTSEIDLLLNTPEPTHVGPKVERNAPCPCGSGKKYKKCCGR